MTDTTANFWTKVKRSADCWEWQGGKATGGYGQARDGRTGRKTGTHRIAWTLTFGPIPSGFCVCHHCDNPPCVRPNHLFLGTVADNNRDMTAKGRSATGNRSGSRLHPECLARGERHGSRTHPERRPRGNNSGNHLHPERLPRGENHVSSKLTEGAVREIRSRVAKGEFQKQIANAFGVGPTAIYNVIHGKTWRHV
jgi:hypothetical protein